MLSDDSSCFCCPFSMGKEFAPVGAIVSINSTCTLLFRRVLLPSLVKKKSQKLPFFVKVAEMYLG